MSLRRASIRLTLAACLALGAIGGSGAREARAEEAPISVGAILVARALLSLDKVTIPAGSKVSVSAVRPESIDLVLPDGHVVRRVSAKRVRYFFDVSPG